MASPVPHPGPQWRTTYSGISPVGGLSLRRWIQEIAALLKLWFFFFVSYLLILTLFTYLYYGWIDLRNVALLQVVVVPMGQAILFWAITFRRRARDQT